MSNAYSKAYVEVLEIMSHFSEEDFKKIPKSEIDFYNENKDNELKNRMIFTNKGVFKGIL